MNEATLEITNIKRPSAPKGSVHGAILGALAAALGGETALAADTSAASETGGLRLTQEWDKVFPKSEKVEHQKITFKNRYGITLAADLYLPKNRENQRLAAIVVGGPFGAVKEQSSGLYAQTMAERGFVTLAFDGSYRRCGW